MLIVKHPIQQQKLWIDSDCHNCSITLFASVPDNNSALAVQKYNAQLAQVYCRTDIQIFFNIHYELFLSYYVDGKLERIVEFEINQQ